MIPYPREVGFFGLNRTMCRSPDLRSITLVTLALVVLGPITFRSNAAAHERALVIFVDVTGSLSTNQFETVLRLFETLVKDAPAAVKLEAYAISREAGSDRPVFTGEGLADDTN